MKNQKTSLLQLALTGTGIGFPITALCVVMIGGWNQAASELVIWAAASALFGIVSGLIFEKSNLNLPLAIAIHCLCCLAIALAAGMLCGYAEDLISLAAGLVPVFVLIYAVVYGAIVLAMKLQAKKINAALNAE